MKADHDASVRHMERLSRMRDYDVAPKEPDPRGWTVVNRDSRAVGKVADLIVDTDRMAAMYLEVELDRKLFDFRGEDPHVLVPVDRARRDGSRLVVDDIGPGWVKELLAAREVHQREFWDHWWHARERRREPVQGTPISRRMHPDELNRVLDGLKPGESVRIPVAEEEIVVERRPIVTDEPVREEVVVNRAADEPLWTRR